MKIKLLLVTLLSCYYLNAQSYTVYKVDRGYEINFIDEFDWLILANFRLPHLF